MPRPEYTEIEAGSQSWDADINAVFDLIFGGPFPFFQVADETALLALDPTEYEDCEVAVESTHEAWRSDGTEWRRIAKAQINASGARHNKVTKTVLLTPLSGPTMTSAGFFPAGSWNRQLSLRVTTLITGCTSFDVGDGSDQDLWALAAALTAGTTKTPADRTHLTNAESIAAKDVVLTAVGGGASFSAGAVRLVGTYEELTAPTS